MFVDASVVRALIYMLGQESELDMTDEETKSAIQEWDQTKKITLCAVSLHGDKALQGAASQDLGLHYTGKPNGAKRGCVVCKGECLIL